MRYTKVDNDLLIRVYCTFGKEGEVERSIHDNCADMAKATEKKEHVCIDSYSKPDSCILRNLGTLP